MKCDVKARILQLCYISYLDLNVMFIFMFYIVHASVIRGRVVRPVRMKHNTYNCCVWTLISLLKNVKVTRTKVHVLLWRV